MLTEKEHMPATVDRVLSVRTATIADAPAIAAIGKVGIKIGDLNEKFPYGKDIDLKVRCEFAANKAKSGGADEMHTSPCVEMTAEYTRAVAQITGLGIITP